MKTPAPTAVVPQTLPGVSTHIRWPRIGVVLSAATGLALTGALLQLLGIVPTHYTWKAPFDIIHGVLSRPFFPSLLVLFWALGLMRLKEWAVSPSLNRRAHWLQSWRQKPRIAETAFIATATVCIDVWIFPQHHWVDLLLLGASACVMSLRLREPSALRLAGINLLWTTVVFTLVSFGYTAVKAALFAARDSQDPVLLQFESALFGEPLHVKVVRFFQQVPHAAAFFDEIYFSFFEHMLLTTALLSGMRQHAQRNQLMAALVFCYVIGAPAYFILPTVGPAYVSPELFQFLNEGAPRTVLIEQMLLRNTGMMLDGAATSLQTFGYVASMPSLHIAHELVMVFFARKSKPACVMASLFAVATFLATLYLGWHYATDAVGGALVAVAAVWLARRFEKRLTPAMLNRTDAALPS